MNEENERSMSCVAYGCPMPAGIVSDGQRYCSLHLGLKYDQFSEVTRKIRLREEWVEAIRLLRSPGLLKNFGASADDDALAIARRTVPDVDLGDKGRYAALLRIEYALAQACVPQEASHRTPVADTFDSLVAAKRMPV